MFTATLLFSGKDWLWPVAGILTLALLVAARAYWSAPAERRVRGVCFGFKAIGFLALAACLLEPLWSGQRAEPGVNSLVLLADNSQSLQIHDRNQTRSRGEVLREMLAPGTAWQTQASEDFQVKRYRFDAQLKATADFADLNFDGRSSALGASLRAVAERHRGQPLAGILLFTDGNATDLAGETFSSAGLPPVYPVVVGKADSIRDLAIQKIIHSQTAFEDAPVTIQAEVAASGFSGATVTAELVLLPARSPATGQRANLKGASGRGSSEKVIATQTQKIRRNEETVAFRFQTRPEHPGISLYRLQVGVKAAGEAVDGAAEEATLANNSRIVVADRGAGPYRILYVAGRPNWEYKFLQRALVQDDQMQMVGLIRIARREPKFEFRGRAGESSNPLFRGFGQQDEEIERYDQPVLIRVNARDAEELRGGFPRTAEELYAYHAIVLDDLEAEFFTHDQMMLIQKFVSERGGGFLMLGGTDSLNQGKFDRTPVGDLLPVYLDRIADTAPLTQLRLSLTREGWLQPWARLRGTESEERERFQAMPPFQVVNRVREVKPGASVMATVTDARGQQHPALMVQRFGHGRSAALAIGDFWRWGLHQEDDQADLGKAWRQLMRWLVADVPGRLELRTEAKTADPNSAVQLQLRARDKEFQPLESASVNLVVQAVENSGPGRNTSREESPSDSRASSEAPRRAEIRLQAEPSLEQAGLYEATFIPREAGAYRVEGVVLDGDGFEVGRVETAWASEMAADEFRSLKPNQALLEKLAKETGGEIVSLDSLADWAAKLPHREMPVTEAWTFPLWHTPWMFLFALGCFVAEWGIRRWKGLA